MIGTRVMDLNIVAKKTGDDPSHSPHIDSYLNRQFDNCDATLDSLLNFEGKPSGLPVDFKEVARLVLQSPNKSLKKVYIDDSNGLKNPPKAAIALKEFLGTRMYHILSNSYRFYSKCHENAAIRYFKE